MQISALYLYLNLSTHNVSQLDKTSLSLRCEAMTSRAIILISHAADRDGADILNSNFIYFWFVVVSITSSFHIDEYRDRLI